MPNLADPDYEPTDEELQRLSHEAFAPIREAKAREDEARRQRIEEARNEVLERFFPTR